MISQPDSATIASNPYEQVRLRVIQGVLMTSVPINLLLLVYQTLIQNEELPTPEIIFRLIHIGFGVIAFVLLQRKQAIEFVVNATLVLAIPLLFITQSPSEVGAIGAFLLAMLAIFTHPYVLGAGIAAFVAALGLLFNQDNGEASNFSLTVVLLLVLAMTGILRFFMMRVRSTISETARIGQLLSGVSQVGQITQQLLDLNPLMDQSVELIRQRFGFYHVQIFLVDEQRNNANLVASTGEVGRILLERGHFLAVGSRSVIGRVTQIGEPIVARATERNTVHSRNELLPDTRAELALPLVDGDNIIGALDVQSTHADAFDATDIQALQVMASQLAITIRNSRLFREQQNSVEENERLLRESKRNLVEIERLNQQLTGEIWRDYFRNNRAISGVTVTSNEETHQADWTEAMLMAANQQEPVVQDGLIAIPIILRGQVLGVVEVEAGDHEQDIADHPALIRAIANRMAIELENTRLFQSTQESTAIESQMNQLTSQYQQSDSVDDLLQITLKQLTETLGATTGMIRLGQVSIPTEQTQVASSVGLQNGDHDA